MKSFKEEEKSGMGRAKVKRRRVGLIPAALLVGTRGTQG